MRQRGHEQLQVELLAAHGGAEVAEVGLAGAGRPLELEVALAGPRRPREPPVAHEALHRGVGARIAALGDEPVEHPFGGVALLARGGQVGLEHRLYPPLVALERRAPPLGGHGRGGRHVLHVGVLGDGVAAHVEPSGYLGPRHAVGVHRAYIIPHVQGHGHLLHPSRAGSPKSPPGKTIRRGPRPRSSGARPSCSNCSILRAHGAQKIVITRTTS